MKDDRAEQQAEAGSGTMRIDKWLWAARFYKTRSLAATAIDSGRVEINGERIKRARSVATGDLVSMRSGPYTTVVEVVAVSEKRGPAPQAAKLFRETDASKVARETIQKQIANMPVRQAGDGRPTKKERRQLRSLRGDD